jgi:hypothetical protein
MGDMLGLRIAWTFCFALTFAAADANAGTLTFDFGTLGASTTKGAAGTACSSNCILSGKAEQWFTTNGVSVGAIGYNGSDQFSYVTQKPGAFGSSGGETGLGESDTYPRPSDSDYEINKTSWLLIDNSAAIAAGYQTSTFSIESLQNGEGAKVYNYTGSLSALDPSKLSLIASVNDPGTGGLTQTFAIGTFNYLVVQAAGSSAADVVVSQEVFNTAPVPEPSAIFILAAGLSGLAFVRRRRTLT